MMIDLASAIKPLIYLRLSTVSFRAIGIDLLAAKFIVDRKCYVMRETEVQLLRRQSWMMVSR